MNDVRFALRQLRKAPGFTVVAVLTLAIGIGACAAIFSVVSSVLLRPLPFPEPDRVVVIRETFLPQLPDFSVASGKVPIWRERAGSFASIAALTNASYNLTGAGEPVRLIGARISANTLPTFRVSPLIGRNFAQAEELDRDQINVTILSHALWQSRFAGRPEIVGQTIQLSGRPYRVVGVMPKESPLPGDFDIFTPYGMSEGERNNIGGHSAFAFGRLAPGATLASAQAEMDVIAADTARKYQNSEGWAIKLVPMLDLAVGQVRPALWSLLVAVGLLLLIACANVANLLLARATARAKELAVRAAVGASRGRVVRQLLVESLVLAALGGGFGILLGMAMLDGLLALAPDTLPRAREIGIDGGVLGFTLALVLLTGVGFGLAPAFQASGARLHETLKQTGRGASEGGHRHRLRGALVVSEVAIALMLLAGAGLLMRSFARLAEVKPGFNPDDVLVAAIHLPRPKYDQRTQYATFATETLAQLRAIPGVRAAGVATSVPFTNSGEARGFAIFGRPPARNAEMPITNHFNVSPDYFKAMGIPLVRGRAFAASDGPDDARVVIINETLARRHFAGEDPVGKRINITNDGPDWREIVGVVGDVKPSTLEGEMRPQTYEPFVQVPDNDMFFLVRTSGEVPGLPAAIRTAIFRLDRDQPIHSLRPMRDWVGESIARQRFAMTLFAAFSLVALVLAAIGVYGVMAYSVSQRAGEIGIRMALGAHAGDVLRLVYAQGGRLIGLGVALGLAGALALTRFLESMLFNTSAQDPGTFLAIVLALAAIASLACMLPALRAARVSPMVALRAE